MYRYPQHTRTHASRLLVQFSRAVWLYRIEAVSSFLLRSSCLLPPAAHLDYSCYFSNSRTIQCGTTPIFFRPFMICESICCARRDPASSAAIYLAFLQVGLEVADLFQAVFSHKKTQGFQAGLSGRAMHTAICRPLLRRVAE